MDFFGRLHFGPLGCCPLKFLDALEIDQALLAHTQGGMGSPQKTESWKFIIWPKIQRVTVNNFRLVGVSSRNFFSDVPRGRGDNVGTIFTRPDPKNLRGQKIVRQLWTLMANILYLRNGSTGLVEWTTIDQLEKTINIDFIKSMTCCHAVVAASANHRCALGRCCPLKIFTRVRLPSAPPKKFNCKNLNFGLKFSVWAPITSGLVGISSPNFSRPRDI